jgi:hypothetical protein
MQRGVSSYKVSLHFEPRRKYTLNATELARNKFNALFAAHDAKDLRAATEKQEFALKTAKKEAKKNVKRK